MQIIKNLNSSDRTEIFSKVYKPKTYRCSAALVQNLKDWDVGEKYQSILNIFIVGPGLSNIKRFQKGE